MNPNYVIDGTKSNFYGSRSIWPDSSEASNPCNAFGVVSSAGKRIPKAILPTILCKGKRSRIGIHIDKVYWKTKRYHFRRIRRIQMIVMDM